MNFYWAGHVFRRGSHFRTSLGGVLNHPQDIPSAAMWGVYAMILFLVSLAHLTFNSDPTQFLLRLPARFKNTVDRLVASPVAYFSISIATFALAVILRKWLVRPTVAWVLLNAALLFS